MLDENLPTFYLGPAKDKVEFHKIFWLTRGGGDPEPAYRLDKPDPSLPASRNAYAIGLFDPYNSDVLYGEVLLRPAWTPPSLSQEEIRRNGGIPPPPEPVMPDEFTIQLYNPDQQVVVRHKASSIVGLPKWEFSMPQYTFRLPSGSQLDRSQNDPIADANTPMINFVWKRENPLRRELQCYMTGRSTDVTQRKKSKEADIVLALFRSLKEVTVYEPNLSRVELEDPKGLEIVLLLATATIRDIWFGNFRQAMNISEGRRSTSAVSSPLSSSATAMPVREGRASTVSGASAAAPAPPLPARSSGPPPPPADALTQWEIDAETARLRAQLEAEQRQEEARRRERARIDEEETRRLQKMVEAEEKERVRREKAIEKETKRLQKLYGNQGAPPSVAGPAGPASPPAAAAASPPLPPAAAAAAAVPAPYNHRPGPPMASGALPSRPLSTGPIHHDAAAGPSQYPQRPVPSGSGGGLMPPGGAGRLQKKRSSAF